VTTVTRSGTTYAVTIEDVALAYAVQIEDTAPRYNVQILDDAGFYACDLDTERSTFVENTERSSVDFWNQPGVNLIRYITLNPPPAPEFDQVIGKPGANQAIGIPGTGQVIGKPK